MVPSKVFLIVAVLGARQRTPSEFSMNFLAYFQGYQFFLINISAFVNQCQITFFLDLLYYKGLQMCEMWYFIRQNNRLIDEVTCSKLMIVKLHIKVIVFNALYKNWLLIMTCAFLKVKCYSKLNGLLFNTKNIVYSISWFQKQYLKKKILW